jgi:glycopeptide antibiotics resistance protein
MTEASTDLNDQLRASATSNRILIAAIAGIIFLTLYPFRFLLNRHVHGPVIPFFLDGWGKAAGPFDVVLNILLFVPYGFGLALKFRGKGKSRAATLGVCLVAGALLSYTIELLQFYIPLRDSGWEDVFTNSTGSVVGLLLFEMCGTFVLTLVSRAEWVLNAWLSLWRTILILTLYCVLCFTISLVLQRQTRLSNWQPDSLLVVGDAISGQSGSGWKGEVYQLELWDHALPDKFARSLTSGGLVDPAGPASLAEYDFSDSPPFQDQRHFLPDLVWDPQTAALNHPKTVVLDGESWLVSRGPVSALADDLQATQQFALRMRCKPDEVAGMDGRIVSIAQASGSANLELRQQGSNLVFWFRTRLTKKRSTMTWSIPNTFTNDQARDILFSYDGLALSLYIDGKKVHRGYQLGPGVALARFVRRIKANESEGYQYIFYTLVFFPAGCIVGFAWRKVAARPIARSLLIALGILLPALLYEILLVRWGGQAMSLENIALWVLIALAGSLWINADGCALNGSVDSDAPRRAR